MGIVPMRQKLFVKGNLQGFNQLEPDVPVNWQHFMPFFTFSFKFSYTLFDSIGEQNDTRNFLDVNKFQCSTSSSGLRSQLIK